MKLVCYFLSNQNMRRRKEHGICFEKHCGSQQRFKGSSAAADLYIPVHISKQ
jgi:hypothetical protein